MSQSWDPWSLAKGLTQILCYLLVEEGRRRNGERKFSTWSPLDYSSGFR